MNPNAQDQQAIDDQTRQNIVTLFRKLSPSLNSQQFGQERSLLNHADDLQNASLPPIPNGVSGGTGGSLQPVDLSSSVGAPGDVQNAEQYLGSGQGFSGFCERFAEEVTGKSPQGLTAADAFNNQLQQGKAVADPNLSGAKAGDLVYFGADSSNENDGHVGILADNGKTFISATYNGVQAYDLKDWEKTTGQKVTGYVPTQ